MKKIAPIFLLGGLAVMTTASIVVGSLAWFSAKARITDTNDPIAAVTNGAYFAYGNGTAEKPYGITKPRHLYNLAWLQYLNYFNKNVDGSGQIIPTYFELGSDVDGEGMVIPPIGNESRPFVGNFDGQGFVISNFVISNNASDFVVKPSAITSYTPTEIVGLFSVVGKLASDTTTSYDTSVNAIYDTGITGLTIKSNTAHTLAGIVAGYVNGTISKVAVSDSTINIGQSGAAAVTDIGTTRLSDYSIVGYCTANYKKTLNKVDETIYDVTCLANAEFNAYESSSDIGWGGSIDMLSMFQRLINIQNNAATNTDYIYKTQTTYNADGTVNGTPTNSTYTSNYRYSPNNKVGNFNFLNKNNSYMYMSGGKRKIDNYYSYYTHTGYPITDGTNYLNYTGSLGNLTGSNAESTCTLWTFTSAGNNVFYISTTYNNTTYYLYNSSNTLAINNSYQNQNSYKWYISNSGTTRDIYSASNTNYHLVFDTSWSLMNLSNYPYYIIYDEDEHYMSNWEGYYTPTASANRSDALKLGYNSSARGYYRLDNTSLILSCYSTTQYSVEFYDSDNYVYRLVDASTGNLKSEVYGEGKLRLFTKSTNNAYGNYYLKYSSDTGSWALTEGIDSGTNMVVEKVEANTLQNTSQVTNPPREGPDQYLDNSRKTSYMTYSSSDTTYFPLNVKSDGGTSSSKITNGDYLPKDSNTGYVVAGSNVGDNTTISDGGPSLIRVSKYAISNINQSYTTSDSEIVNSKVYTINGSGQTTIASAISGGATYERYADSKKTLYEKALQGNSNVYGLHFMSSQISASNVVSASNVSILGVDYDGTDGKPSTYDLPVNSIDFNLKEKGYINFFAGTYFSSTVTSFFSLHQVLRNSNTTIAGIKEIQAVYGNTSKKNYSYIYQYKDGTYSKPYRFDGNKNKYEMSTNNQGTTAYVPDYNLASISTYTASPYNYVKLFDTNWITNYSNPSTKIRDLTQKALYYFEIPMNDGEFCLGSVDGGTGGYLLYLDIGANASKIQRSSFIEHFIKTEQTFEYPLGVALLPTNKAGANDFSETNTACVYILANYQGNLVLSRTGNDITVTRTSTTLAKPTYVGEEVTALHDPGGTSILAEVVPKESHTTETLRLQYYDYNVQLGELVRTIITDVKVDNGAFTRTVKQYIWNNDEWQERTGDQIKVYSTSTGIKYDLDALSNYNSHTLDFTSTTNTVLVTIHYVNLDVDGVSVTENIELVLKVDDTDLSVTYYVFDYYDIQVTSTGGSIVIKVTAKGSKTIKINGTEVSNGDSITITP